MNFLQLKYFHALANSQHLLKTAHEMFVTPSAISLSISNLEDELGVKLFDRAGRNIRLNHYGEAFLKYAEIILQAQHSAITILNDMKENGELNVHIAMKHGFVWFDCLKDFHMSHPEINLIQRDIEAEVQRLDLKQRDIDFVITAISLPADEWNTHDILTTSVALLVAKDHRLAQASSVSLCELKDENILGYTFDLSFRTLVESLCNDGGFAPKYVAMGDYPLITYLCSQGIGVAFAYMHNHSLLTKQLDFMQACVAIPICDLPDYGRKIFRIAWRKSRYLSQAAKLFRDFLLDYFADYRE